MIQPQELRLGNLFQDAKGRLCKVEQISIDPYETKIRSIDHSITSMPIAAIPLTEEWLVKLGYTFIESANCFVNEISKYGYDDEMNITHDDYGFTFTVVGNHEGGFDVNIKFVHQLQNLYFALTGLELGVKI